jgi:hypothetical protein
MIKQPEKLSKILDTAQGPYSGQKGRGLVVPSEWMV